jgi:hypothetical protein
VEFHETKDMEFHGWISCIHGIPWNLVSTWNFVEFHETEVDGIPWNSMVEFREFMEFHGIRFRQGSHGKCRNEVRLLAIMR